MKKYSPVLLISSFVLFLLASCTKINESTTLGGDLIPPVDNINTFEVALDAQTADGQLFDSTIVAYTDAVALGHLNASNGFGSVDASFTFNFAAPFYGSYPFLNPIDSLPAIDSVVLSLGYAGAYGDTLLNGTQTVTVEELPTSTAFRADSIYRYRSASSDFSGSPVGNRTYEIRRLKDTSYVKEVSDTAANAITKYTNVLRIRLNNSVGTKLADFDTSLARPAPGYYSDSAFRSLFPGLTVRSSNSGNALAYFNLADGSRTRLIVYYKYKRNGRDTSATAIFTHSRNGQANYVKVNGSTPAPDRHLLQGAPSGDYVSIVIPSLPALGNQVVHRAELIATSLDNPNDPLRTPYRLFLDRDNLANPDTTFIFERDLLTSQDGSVGYATFGGDRLSDNTWKFNITRYVQNVLTNKAPNDTLRLYAAFRAQVFNPTFITSTSPRGGEQILPVNGQIYPGRVTIAGGNFADPNRRLRLRIIYSRL